MNGLLVLALLALSVLALLGGLALRRARRGAPADDRSGTWGAALIRGRATRPRGGGRPTPIGAELDQLKAEVARMAGLAEAQIADAIDAVARRDVALARSVVDRDRKLDELQHEIDRKAIRLIALRQPVADDLRRTVAAMKIAADLERIGDLAKNIAKRSLVLAESEPVMPLTRSVTRMGKLVALRVKAVLDAYAAGELEGAMAVWSSDIDVDEHYNSLFRELLTYMMGDSRTIGACAHLLFMAKNLERIGDHATNIAEFIHYELTGAELDDAERPRQTGVSDHSDLQPHER